MSNNIFNLLNYTISKDQHRKLGNLLESMNIKLNETLDMNGKTLLFLAAECNAYKSIAVILKYGVSFNLDYDRLALHAACQRGYLEAVTALLKQPVGLNEFDNNGMTPIFYAVNCFNSETKMNIIRSLLECGADMHAKRNESGFSALDSANKLTDQSIAQYLVSFDDQSKIEALIKPEVNIDNSLRF